MKNEMKRKTSDESDFDYDFNSHREKNTPHNVACVELKGLPY